MKKNQTIDLEKRIENVNIDKTFFEKAKSHIRRNAAIYFASATLAVGGIIGCGPDGGPSKECCDEKKCYLSYNPPICDGDGDDCYCRDETCCEKLSCPSDMFCVETGCCGSYCIGECGCECIDYGKR